MNFRRFFTIIVIALMGSVVYLAYSTGRYLDYLRKIPFVETIPYLSDLPGLATATLTNTVSEITAETSLTPIADSTAPSSTVTDVISTSNEIVTQPMIDEITIVMADTITTLDPYRMVSTNPDSSLSTHLWDTLMQLNDDLEIDFRLAESFRLVNNFTWEVKLRPGIRFHNGEAVNAQAVLFSVNRARSLPDSLETFTLDIHLDEVRVIDDLTVQFVTNQPVANLDYHLAFLEILPPAYYSETDLATLSTNPIGSGPYQVLAGYDSDEITLEAVDTYWAGQPTIPRLVFLSKPDVNDRFETAMAQIPVIVSDLPPIVEGTWKVRGTQVIAIESTQRLFIGMHIVPDSPFEMPEVRQALNYAINVEAITEDWLAGYGERYGSWVNPPNSHPTLVPWPYDPERAKTLLATAGFSGSITTTLAIPIGLYDAENAIAQIVAEQLAEVGVTVTIIEEDWPVYLRRLHAKDRPALFLLGLNSHGNGLEDVKNLSSIFPFNPTGWHNALFEDGLKRAMNTLNRETRTRRLYELQEIGYHEAPWIWLWRPYRFYIISDELSWQPRRDGLIYLYKSASEIP